MNAVLIADGLLTDLGLNFKVLGVQAIIFLATFFILSKLLFGRALSFMQAREEEAARAREAIRRDREEAERRAKEYENHVARLEKEAYERLQAILKEALETRGKIVADAQRRAAEELKAALEALEQEKRAAMASLRNEILAISQEAAERAIGIPLDGVAMDDAIRNAVAEVKP
ncbi:MAG: ATP synthase F0 subunit B [Planctomycetes bacterium]|nr:ATP synthase F0 subunit B [Planctomycetota bacterium]